MPYRIGDIKHIIIIESLENERLTGTELYNDIIKRNIDYRQSSITHAIFAVNSKDKLVKLLEDIGSKAQQMGGGILLHLEMHGDGQKKGLFLADGTLINWEELVALFRSINIKTCNKLYVSLATCNGRYLYEGVNPDAKSPYSCFISASIAVTASEIVDQFSRLFEHLIESGNLVKAYLEMEAQGTEFFYKDSKTTFEESFKMTEHHFRNDPTVRENIQKEVSQALIGMGYPAPSKDVIDAVCEQALQDIYRRQKEAFYFSDCV